MCQKTLITSPCLMQESNRCSIVVSNKLHCGIFCGVYRKFIFCYHVINMLYHISQNDNFPQIEICVFMSVAVTHAGSLLSLSVGMCQRSLHQHSAAYTTAGPKLF